MPKTSSFRAARTDRYCGGETDSFFHFILPGILQQDGKTRINVPLNWILSEATGIWDAMDDTASGNPECRIEHRLTALPALKFWLLFE